MILLAIKGSIVIMCNVKSALKVLSFRLTDAYLSHKYALRAATICNIYANK